MTDYLVNMVVKSIEKTIFIVDTSGNTVDSFGIDSPPVELLRRLKSGKTKIRTIESDLSYEVWELVDVAS